MTLRECIERALACSTVTFIRPGSPFEFRASHGRIVRRERYPEPGDEFRARQWQLCAFEFDSVISDGWLTLTLEQRVNAALRREDLRDGSTKRARPRMVSP